MVAPRIRATWLAVVCAALTSSGAALGCPLQDANLKKGAVELHWSVDGAPIAVGKHFSMNVRVCPADARLIRADATMPEHRHGMNYRASMKPLGDGRWRVEGMMLHMPGRWELRFEVQSGERVEALTESLRLP